MLKINPNITPNQLQEKINPIMQQFQQNCVIYSTKNENLDEPFFGEVVQQVEGDQEA
jgi:hypothetical protein